MKNCRALQIKFSSWIENLMTASATLRMRYLSASCLTLQFGQLFYNYSLFETCSVCEMARWCSVVWCRPAPPNSLLIVEHCCWWCWTWPGPSLPVLSPHISSSVSSSLGPSGPSCAQADSKNGCAGGGTKICSVLQISNF